MNRFSYNKINKDPLTQAVLKILVGEDATETKSPAVDGDVKTIPVRKGKSAVKSAAKDMEDETGSQRKLAADMDDQVVVAKEAKEDDLTDSELRMKNQERVMKKQELKNSPKYKLLTKKQFGKMKHWDKDRKDEEVVAEVNNPTSKGPNFLNGASNSGSANKANKSPNFLNKNKSGQSAISTKPMKEDEIATKKSLTKEEQEQIEAKLLNFMQQLVTRHEG